MDGWMDERTNGWMRERMDGRVNLLMDGWLEHTRTFERGKYH